ncbi:MAG: SDR family oxidoreductase [Candidatus Tectomicrobia bacterium]
MAEQILEGRVVIMTGAGRGLGRAMTLGLVRSGARVTMVDVDEDVLAEAAEMAEQAGGPGCVQPLKADVTRDSDTRMVVENTRERYGRVDILVNNAAIGPQVTEAKFMSDPMKSWEVNPEVWQWTLSVNALGPFQMIRSAVPHLVGQGWGRVINITTSLNTMYQPGCSPYGPSKAALEAYTALLSTELEGTGVTANVLIPGGPANTRMIPEHGFFTQRDGLIQPEQMVPPLLWLCSEAANGVNGRRFRAALWDLNMPTEAASEQAGAPVAWTQLGSQSIRPDQTG